MTKGVKKTATEPQPKQKFSSKPRKPDLSECSRRNCVNCVFIYYQKALNLWKKKVADIEATYSR